MTIHPPYRAFYGLGIGFCLNSAVRSIESISKLVSAVDERNVREALSKVDPEAVLDDLQNIVVQGASVSRYFWPVRSKYDQRGAELRIAYKVSDESPLRNRELRNSIEHFDERLDDYLSEFLAGTIYPHYLGVEPPPSPVKQHFFRAYFIDTGVFQLLEHRFHLEPISQEIWRLAGGTVAK